MKCLSRMQNKLLPLFASMFDSGKNFNEKGYLRIGFTQSQPNIADWYTNNGSMYITSVAFLPLGLPASHPFWTDAPMDWTSKRACSTICVNICSEIFRSITVS